MAPQPIASNAQKQRLTTALKNICRDYPAGGTVIRELLQNADDAGATEVRFVLDDRTHPTENLIHPSLAQYQGPALLSFNNAVFLDKDFESLSRLGDSLKLNDGATTGRFGRGFNSVYNWTDSPSIISRERLLILDPHQEWSDGGPVYNFVRDSEDLAIKNQMVTYQFVMDHVDQPLNGTVIRIPLRNATQTLKSDISSLSTTTAEIEEVLSRFSAEFGSNGLLFMRNVTKLVITSARKSLEIQMIGDEDIRNHKTKINNAVKSALMSPSFSFHHNFQAGIQHTSNEKSTTTQFMVQHIIQDSMDDSLRSWARDQQLIPWVAVAAQLPLSPANNTQCSLFTVLPLPLQTVQPVHIHALFSLTPDRANLHRQNDQSTQNQDPGKWNDWLFKQGASAAWVKLLVALAKLYPLQSAFEKWPKLMENKQELLSDSVDRIVEIIQKDRLSLWPTDTGYVNANTGLLALGSETAALKEALQEAKAPVVYVPKFLQKHAKGVFIARCLSPENVCAFLNSRQEIVSTLSEKAKITLVEYILSSTGLLDYGDLEIFPFEDANFRSLNGIQAFVHRDELDEALFHKQKGRNLAIQRLSVQTQKTLKQRCGSSTLHPSIQYRSSQSLREYCTRTIFKKLCAARDMASLDTESATFSTSVLTWISDRRVSMQDKNVKSLWLLPLSNGGHRKIIPQESTSKVYIAAAGLAGDVMRRIDARLSIKQLPLLCTEKEKLGRHPSAILKQIRDAKVEMGVEDASNLVVFLRWLSQTLTAVENLDDEERHNIAKAILSKLSEPLANGQLAIATQLIRNLEIFQKLTWEFKGDSFRAALSWTSLSSCAKSVGLLDCTTQVAEIPGVHFLIATSPSSQYQILTSWNLAPCLRSVDVLQDYIIPAWKNRISDKWSTSYREQSSAYIFGNFSSLSLETQESLQNIPLVPVTKMGLEEDLTCSFACACDLIDPSVTELARLCFEYEEIVPKDSFFRKFRVALTGCGVKTSVDEAVVSHRVRCYASGNYPPAEVKTRAILLLTSSCRWSSSSNSQKLSEVRCLAWLPTTDMHGVESLKASSQCRGLKDRPLVGSQMPILGAILTEEWESRLGWRSIIPTSVLLPQLKHGISKLDRQIVDAVLSYVDKNSLIDCLAAELKTLQCVFVRNDFFVEPSQAFRPARLRSQGCNRLQPYVANVDDEFWREHEKLLTHLGVREEPQPADLMKLQCLLEAKDGLDEHDVGVAIEVLKLASWFPRDSLHGLKILGASGKFYRIGEIYYNDLGGLRSKQHIILTHPDIPVATINRLKIDSLSAQRVKGILEIDDDNDDEFDQQESTITRISDTLERYPIETTFREYLANADDTDGASRISWVLDNRCHPIRTLITPQMKELQGPSLLSFNDGVFSSKDFDGFKNVGEGSKMQEKGSIGQFGRGSQTMFHFTDYPMILSGDYLLILDPQQEVLPLNPSKGRRKPGMKVKLSRVREACPDQLIPFIGFFGYGLDLDHFPGTIFRFPLVTPASKGLLRTSRRELNNNEICRLMNTYFDEARSSLLFLRRIKSIEFGVYGKPHSGWSIHSDGPLRRTLGSDLSISRAIVCTFIKHKEFDSEPTTGTDNWQVCIQDLSSKVELLPATSKRAAKTVECGIAALVCSVVEEDIGGLPATTIEPRMFNTLPLPIASDLPVHVHASFSLSGDRKSIALEEYGSTSPGAESNRHLLQDALPKLYLKFLCGLVERIHQESLVFWPQDDPPTKSFGRQVFEGFWKELPCCSLPILPKAHYPTDGQRESVGFDQAVFDFLPKQLSERVLPLLISLGVDLVRDIPKSLAKLLNSGPNSKQVVALSGCIRQVGGATLKNLFKSKGCGTKFLNAMKANAKVWGDIFDLLVPPNLTIDEAKELDGCHILPLADKTLGTLKIIKQNQDATYYLVSYQELQLFNFASESLVFLPAGSQIDALLTKGKFNLQRLQLCHVAKLLTLRPDIQSPSTATDQWLTSFWAYWNTNRGHDFIYPQIDSINAKLYKATCNSFDEYITPKDFDLLPAVVRSSNPEHKQLCERVPGIYHVNSTMMPKSSSQEEKSLDSPSSFCRFIRALVTLGHLQNIETFIGSHLDDTNTEVLRGLVVDHVSGSSVHVSRLIDHMKLLPLWPSFVKTPAAQLIPAGNALWATSPSLMMPWMRHSSQFLDPQFLSASVSSRNASCVTALGVQKIPSEVLLRDYVLPLPPNVGNSHWPDYKSLIEAIVKSNLSGNYALKCAKFAADGNQILKKASELFDHQNSLFKAAFTLDISTRFIHVELQSYRNLWLLCGLQHDIDGFIDPRQYRECLQVMVSRANQSRVSDPTYSKDIREVLAPMTTTNQRLARFNPDDWQAIAQMQVFQSRTNFNGESEYCRGSMTEVAKGKPAQSLWEIISQEYIPVCWSQVPFAIHEPAPEAFSKMVGTGKPRVVVVWRHLQTLKALSQRLKSHQAQDFLEDLKKTYQYLQDRLDESLATFDLADNVVWLNMEEWNHHSILIEDLRVSWQSIDQLVLSSSVDSGPIKAVRPGLMVYEKLLRGLGCKSIAYPTITLPPPPEGYSVVAALRQLRKDGKMLDITYTSEGRTVKAHRVVLASVSDHCKSQFCGGWSVPPTITFDKTAEPDAFLSYRTLKNMIDFAYEEPIDWKEMEVVDSDDDIKKALKLDMLLNLCKGADYWLIPSLVSQAEARLLAAGRRFIDLDNVVDVRDRAELSGATHFHKLCEEFIEQNRDAVERAHSEERKES
ncbi:hypothetical protein BKA65DRAFT_404568 [Rhexocercosporidium sp. MPI-PUGE-AT-0058]|nr:hypothetical protein BKA65DRAFT_404568 [Rhexocercosporidium sp. MPI-PUGE-AT-0058]